MRIDFHRIALVVVPVIMMTTACLAGYGLLQFSKDAAVIRLSESLITSSQHMLLDLVDAETGQRGYILTGSQSFLDIYTTGVRSFQMDVMSGAMLAASDPQDATMIAQLAELANAKLAEMAKTIVARTDSGLEPAQKMVEDGNGKRIMDEFRNVTATFRSIQQDRVDAAQVTNAHLATMTIISIIFSIILMVVWLMSQGKSPDNDGQA